MARFPIVPSRGLLLLSRGRGRLLSVVRSGEPHPSAADSSTYYSYRKAPASYWMYTAEASSYICSIGIFVPTTAASSSRPLRRSYATSPTAADTGAQSEAVVSVSCPSRSSSASCGWGFLPLAAVATLGGCVGGAFATYGLGGLGEEVYEDEAVYKNMPYQVTDVSGRTAILMPSFEDREGYSYTRSTFCGGLQLVRPILHLEGSARKSAVEGLQLVRPILCLEGSAGKSAVEGLQLLLPVLCGEGSTGYSAYKFFELRGVSYRLLKPQMYKELYRKLRVTLGKFSSESDARKKIKEAFKKALSLVLMQLKFELEFVLYILEEGVVATGKDILFGGLVFLLTGFLSWLLKGTPFRERFMIEQPEDHLAHLTLKVMEEGFEVTKLLKDHVEMNQEMTDTVIAEHSDRILSLEKGMLQQSNVMKRLEELEAAVNKIQAMMNAQKPEGAEEARESS